MYRMKLDKIASSWVFCLQRIKTKKHFSLEQKINLRRDFSLFANLMNTRKSCATWNKQKNLDGVIIPLDTDCHYLWQVLSSIWYILHYMMYCTALRTDTYALFVQSVTAKELESKTTSNKSAVLLYSIYCK